MADRASASERLREYVRERVKPGQKHYRRGNMARLAEHLEGLGFTEDAAWISAYVDPNADPRRNASVDAALAICSFFTVNLTDFSKSRRPQAPTTEPPPAPLVLALSVPAIAETVRAMTLVLEPHSLLVPMNAARLAAGLQTLEQAPESSAGKPLAKRTKSAKGSRRQLRDGTNDG